MGFPGILILVVKIRLCFKFYGRYLAAIEGLKFIGINIEVREPERGLGGTIISEVKIVNFQTTGIFM